MATITDYLTQLQADKQALVDNLNTMEVEVSDSETFTTLVPKVLDIKTGVPIEDYFILDTKDVTVSGISMKALVKQIPYIDITSLTTLVRFFEDFKSLITIPLLDTSNVTVFAEMFSGCYNLQEIPLLDTSKGTNFNRMFSACTSLETVPLLDLSSADNVSQMFQSCNSLTSVPSFDISNATKTNSMFNGCNNLTVIPYLDTSKSTSVGSMFANCYLIETIPLLDISNATDIGSMFSGCSNLKEIPDLDTSSATNARYMFNGCTSLLQIPSLNTGNVLSFNRFAYGCTSLLEVGELNMTSANDIYDMIAAGTANITTLGGFLNLGSGYTTTQSANYSFYTLQLSSNKNLTEQSLINVLTKLYDIKTKGCNAQKINVGATNLAKLTSAEGQAALVQATEYGWTVS